MERLPFADGEFDAAFLGLVLHEADDLDRALAAAPEGDPLSGGVKLVLRSLEDALGRHGVKSFHALGEPFDPHLHQAVQMVDTTEAPDHQVLEELQRGYKLKDRLLSELDEVYINGSLEHRLPNNLNISFAYVEGESLLMGINALWSAARSNIPVLVIVANNRSYYNDELHQEGVALKRGRDPANRWIGQSIDRPAPDIARLAEGQGWMGIGPVTKVSELGDVMKRAIECVRAGKPCLVDVHIDARHGRNLRESMQVRGTESL